MTERTQQPSQRILSAKYTYAAGVVFANAAAAIGLLDPIVTKFRGGDVALGVAYLVLLVSVGVISVLIYRSRPKYPTIEPLREGIFVGPRIPDRDHVWPRILEERQLWSIVRKAIERSIGRPVVLVGRSGVGKSVLVRERIVPQLEAEDWHVILVSDYGNFKTRLRDMLSEIARDYSLEQFADRGEITPLTSSTKLWFVFDQFEQFLAATSRRDGEGEEQRRWVKSFIERSAKTTNIRHLLVVRQEWYYDLRFLEEAAPSPFEAADLSGLQAHDRGMVTPALKDALGTVTGGAAADAILRSVTTEGEILPVEVQVIGQTLENLANINPVVTERDYQRLGGKEGLIRRYCEWQLNASPDPEVTLQLLFALSVETRLRKQLSPSQLTYILHKSETEVSRCLNFLVKDARIVLGTSDGKYELVHDYLAERFHAHGRTELDARDIDNIAFYWRQVQAGAKAEHTKTILDVRRMPLLSDFAMGFLALLLVGRLTGPAYGVQWEWLNALAGFEPRQRGIDLYYAPVFMSHLAWSIYVMWFYRRFFSRLRETGVALALSKLTVLTCVGCVLSAAFVPYAWLVAIAVGGIAVGVKLYHMSEQKEKESGDKVMNRTAAKYFRGAGIQTLGNVAVVLVAGLGLVYYVQHGSLSEQVVDWINALSIFAAVVMTRYMVIVTRSHVTRDAASRLLGWVDRPR